MRILQRLFLALVLGVLALTSVSCSRADASTLARGGWRPSYFSSLVVDFDADKIAGNDGDAVAAWANQAPTGAAADLSQPTAGSRPLLKRNILNGHSTVLFDGADDMLYNAGTPYLIPAGAASIYVVFKSTTTGATSTGVYQVRSTTSGYIFQLLNFGGYQPYSVGFDSPFSGNGVGIADAATTTAHVFGVVYAGGGTSTAANYTINLDGTSKTVVASGSWAGATAVALCLGARAGGGFAVIIPWAGHIARFLVFKTNLATADHQAVVKYLRTIYGI